jgi:hypothetical protein
MRRDRLVPLLLLCAGSLRADDVLLHNGKVFEGVIVAERERTLDLTLPGGTISIPKSSVREIVASDSPYAEYLSRAAELRRGEAEAARWVELARWAAENRMDTAAREAALTAAALDPSIAELAPLMRSLGYELDESSGQWLPFEEVMRHRGFVLVDGSWLTREEAADLRRRIETEARARETERIARAAAEIRLAAAELEMQRASREPAPAYGGWGDAYAPYFWPVGAFPPGSHGPHAPGADRPRPRPDDDRGAAAPPPAPTRASSKQNRVASPAETATSGSARAASNSGSRRP